MSSRLGVVQLGGDLTTVRDVSRRVKLVRLGSVWTNEFYERSATVSLAAMSQATRTVTVGSAIGYAVGRSPLVLAAEARDIDELSGGRLTLGLCTGARTMQRGWHSVDPAGPAVRIEELVPLLRQFWSMDESGIDHEGRFYSVHLRPTGNVRQPLRADIPIYLAGVNTRMVQSAGRGADGLIGHPIFTRRYVHEVIAPALSAGAAHAGRSMNGFVLAGYLMCSVHDIADLARAQARAQIAFYAVVRTYAAVFELHGFGDQMASVREAWKQREYGTMLAAVPEDLVDLIAITGNPQEVRERFEAGYADLYDHTLLHPPTFGLSDEQLTDNVAAIIETFARQR